MFIRKPKGVYSLRRRCRVFEDEAEICARSKHYRFRAPTWPELKSRRQQPFRISRRLPRAGISRGFESRGLNRRRGTWPARLDKQMDRLPKLATELVQRGLAVIAAGGPSPVFAVSAANTQFPEGIDFQPSADACWLRPTGVTAHEVTRRADR
jgi:hypothetical protein